MVAIPVVPVTASHPLRPVTSGPAPTVALFASTTPLRSTAEQVAPQLIPGGLEVTVPLPLPALVTVRVKPCRVKMVVTARAPLIVTVQDVPETASQPLPPAKAEPVPVVAARVTTGPLT